MNDPMDPLVAHLLRSERARPGQPGSTKARVFARVQSTLAIAPPDASPAPLHAAAGWGSVVPMTVLALLLAGAAGVVAASRAMPDGQASAATRGAAIAMDLLRAARTPSITSAPAPGALALGETRRTHAGATSGAPSGESDLSAETLLLDRARRDLLHGDADAALIATAEHARRFPHGLLSEERDALRVEALVAATHYDDARAAAARFRVLHRGSVLMPTVDSALREIP
jgi:hypothetical protein